MGLYSRLTFRDVDVYGWEKHLKKNLQEFAAQVHSRLDSTSWNAILRDCDHPREKVRAGSLLLLCHHPERPVFLARARQALEDPAEIVRIAAAGTLAYYRDGGGEARLIQGLGHPRWEVRWWCAKSLTYLGTPESLAALRRLEKTETDPWLQKEMKEILASF